MTNINATLKMAEARHIKKQLPEIRIGDYVKMRVKVAEADKMRVHPWEGTVVRMSGGGTRASFTVRKISFGEGVERTFPTHSPLIESLDIITRGHISQAKLYYLRDRIGKKAKVKVKDRL